MTEELLDLIIAGLCQGAGKNWGGLPALVPEAIFRQCTLEEERLICADPTSARELIRSRLEIALQNNVQLRQVCTALSAPGQVTQTPPPQAPSSSSPTLVVSASVQGGHGNVAMAAGRDLNLNQVHLELQSRTLVTPSPTTSVVENAPPPPSDAQGFDTFLCHNSLDKPAVIQMALEMVNHGVRPWLDVWDIQPGHTWQDVLDKQLSTISSVTVCIGPRAESEPTFQSWQQLEVQAALNLFADKQCSITPVILPGVRPDFQLPLFLRGFHAVDLRQGWGPGIQQLSTGLLSLKGS